MPRPSPRRPAAAIAARLLGLALLLPLPAAAAERVALVIGMGGYEALGPLDNPVPDARAIAGALAGIGFEVTQVLDAPLADLRAAMGRFAFEAETAELALIYFAGHGVQVQGENFLLPVDAAAASNAELQRRSVSLRDFLATVDGARRMRIVILDSCRDNPLGGGIAPEPGAAAPPSGMAPASPERGTLVAYAARDGQTALDGTDGNSPFAAALVEKLTVPGLEISLMFRQVRDEVLRRTANLQEPHTYGSLSGVPYYIAGPARGQDALPAADPVLAWASLRPEEEAQLVALAGAGDTRSMVGLAYRHLNAAGDFRPAEAVTLFARAAEAGSPVAQFELGKLYEKGLGVEADPGRALDLYRASAAQEFPDALNDLGYLYFQGGLGLRPDRQQALAYFERAADQRHPEAQFNFAALIDDGLVPGKGPAEAARYLYAALRSGNASVLEILQTRSEMFGIDTRKALQGELSRNAFYDQPIDGQFGEGTRRGLRRAYGAAE
ncbi:caspase family protein [Mangrovicoccus algicola]|uniref:Caspase family protein n=1 Tax=Mangrovicoccus algicola TaxID=2771008 RepID=A0A8J6YWV7_9RHOB|nr:caspase family protein [Mangrovicoccus algicola]MBE3637281.1 caspase family protein [Mangrovicoccus algicola]